MKFVAELVLIKQAIEQVCMCIIIDVRVEGWCISV